MEYRLLADAALLLHLAFVLFVVAGALLVVRWRALAGETGCGGAGRRAGLHLERDHPRPGTGVDG